MKRVPLPETKRRKSGFCLGGRSMSNRRLHALCSNMAGTCSRVNFDEFQKTKHGIFSFFSEKGGRRLQVGSGCHCRGGQYRKRTWRCGPASIGSEVSARVRTAFESRREVSHRGKQTSTPTGAAVMPAAFETLCPQN